MIHRITHCNVNYAKEVLNMQDAAAIRMGLPSAATSASFSRGAAACRSLKVKS
ncbi:MAG: hypothetical protein M0Q13_04675 [Methanothrix sp.]|nr:hypothetical protein [Methanothrix sp.]